MRALVSIFRALWTTLKHLLFHGPETVCYPEQRPYLPPRYRGRIVLTRDPDGEERCVACYLCAVVCPVDCIALEAAERNESNEGPEREVDISRRYPEWFRINFSRCIFCGLCEEACPTYAIQLTPDFEMAEYNRNHLVYEKEDLLVNGPGKYPGYNFYRVAGIELAWKKKGEGENEKPPVDLKDLMP